jgi:hypothetical protein
MEIDRDLLQKINMLEDDTLAKLIGNVANSFGIDPALTGRYLQDMPKIKKTVSGLTDENLVQLTRALGEENVEKLVSQVRREVDG